LFVLFGGGGGGGGGWLPVTLDIVFFTGVAFFPFPDVACGGLIGAGSEGCFVTVAYYVGGGDTAITAGSEIVRVSGGFCSSVGAEKDYHCGASAFTGC
jgi:hypothetical protein